MRERTPPAAQQPNDVAGLGKICWLAINIPNGMSKAAKTLGRMAQCLAESNAYEALQQAKAALHRCGVGSVLLLRSIIYYESDDDDENK